MLGLKRLFNQQEDINNLIAGIKGGLDEQLVAGLSGSARTLYIASIYEKSKKPIVIITYNLLQAQKLYDDLVHVMDEGNVALYPANELIGAEISVASPELKAQRIEVLNLLSKREKSIIIVPIAGMRKIVAPPSEWKRYQHQITLGDEVNIDEMLMHLVEMGYVRSDMVSALGEFSVRGGIIDVFPLTEQDPIRIELFDTEVDSIRTFSLDDQRSIEKRKEVSIGPATEMPLRKEDYVRLIDRLELGRNESLKKIKDEKVKAQLVQNIGFELEQLRNGQKPEQIFKYLAIAYGESNSLLDYFSKDTILIVDEISRVLEMNESLEKEEAEWYTSLISEGNIIHDIKVTHNLTELIARKSLPVIYLSLFLRHVPNTNPQNIINLTCKQMQNFHGQMNVLKGEVDRWRKGNFAIVFLGADSDRVSRLERILADYEIEADIVSDQTDLVTGKVQIMQGDLLTGFELPIQKVAVVTEEELFTKRVKRKKRKQTLSNAERIKNYSELKVGDHVVHVNHGIGKYLGIETLVINGVHKDYLHIRYQGR